jgi:hypothetical protein
VGAKKKGEEEMKILKHSSLMIVILVCLFFSLGTEALAEVTYVGEYCFHVTPVVCPIGAPCVPIGLQVGVLSYGDNHYVINGTVNSTSPVYGTGFIQGNIATVSLSNTTATSFNVIYIDLDLNTFTGTYTIMPIFPSPSTSQTTSLTGVPCQ